MKKGVSLIITTYNRPDALKCSILSIQKQSVLPDEVIIADDGSTVETAELIKKLNEASAFPIRHSWQEDEGFQAAKARNKAIALASHEYIIIIDGDIFVHRNFVEDHLHFRRQGHYLQGSRVNLGPELTQKMIADDSVSIHPWTPQVINRKNTIRAPFINHILQSQKNNTKGTRSCNMSFWRADVVKINGFDEEYIGWGREDSDFALRLQNAGIRRKNVKFAAMGYHLFHSEESRASLTANDSKLQEAILRKKIRCKKGISQWL